MNNNARFLGSTILVGAGVGVLTQGDLSSINLQNLSIDEIQNYLNTLDLGSFNSVLSDMKESITAILKAFNEIMQSSKT